MTKVWRRSVARRWSCPARWSQQLEAAYQQKTAGAIAGLYEFAPDAEVEAEVEAPAENGQPDLELVEA